MFVETKLRPQGEQQVGKLKLSEAIRIGARLRPQGIGVFFDLAGRSCAMGAAMEARGIKPFFDEGIPHRVREACPEFVNSNGGGFSALAKQIYQKNDSGATREQIADWLASIGY